jgi:hypothetical protein
MLRLENVPSATKETGKVALWVFVSAGLTAVITWILGKPEYAQYYGIANIILFWLKELNKEVEKKKK